MVRKYYMPNDERFEALVKLYLHYSNQTTFYKILSERKDTSEAERREMWNLHCQYGNKVVLPLTQVLGEVWNVQDIECEGREAIVLFADGKTRRIKLLKE